MCTQSLEHLTEVGVRATMDMLETQRSVINFKLLKGEKPCHSFPKVADTFSKACLLFKCHRWGIL